MTELLGMRLDAALALLAERGIADACAVEALPPRRTAPGGTPRVIRVSQAGKRLLYARFPDEVQTGEDK